MVISADEEVHAPLLKPIGLENKLNEVLSYLKGTEYSPVWVVGPPGIGKTTLLNELRRILLNDWKFTIVVLLEVNKEVNIRDIQQKIGEQLMIDGGSFRKLNTTCRAVCLKSALSRVTSVIMLDDVWETLGLEEIGIPSFSGSCRIVLATRFGGIASIHRFRIQSDNFIKKIVHMEYLNIERSMEIFNAARGNKDLKDKKIVRKIVGKCGGLPLALVTIGKAATSQSKLEEIDKALTDSPAEISGMVENVFKVLKSNLDYIDSKEFRHCFLYCALFRDFKDVNKHELYRYWKGEDLIERNHNFEDMITKLLDACLLEEGRDENHVRMHNMVQAMGRWLATGGGGNDYEVNFYARGRFDNPDEITLAKKMKEVQWASFIDLDIEKLSPLLRLYCPHLSTLLMGLYDGRQEAQSKSLCHYQLIEREYTNNINFVRYQLPDAFFENMLTLRVVDVTGHPILQLPNSLCHLESLSYLNLSWTFIQKIPLEFARLIGLRYLDLSHTPFLSSIPKGILDCLIGLKSFNIFGSSYTRINQEGEMNLTQLRGLHELGLSLQDGATIAELLEEDPRFLRCITSLQLAFIDYMLSGSLISGLGNFGKLETLSVKSCEIIDEELKILGPSDLTLQDIVGVTKITIPRQIRILKLHISQCSQLKDVSCLCQLPELNILEIEECEGIVKLVKASCFTHVPDTECLSSLKSLRLDQLPELVSISDFRLSLGSLGTVFINKCPKLKKLPMSSSRQPYKRKIKILCDRRWWEGLEWEDDNVQGIFFPTVFLPQNDEFIGVIHELEDSLRKLKIDAPQPERVREEVRKKIEEMKGLLSWGNNHKFSEHDVEKHREQVDATISTARELLSEMSDWNRNARKGPRFDEVSKDPKEEKRIEKLRTEEGVQLVNTTKKMLDKSKLIVGQSVHADKLSQVMRYLMEDGKPVIAIVGAAGVGKTTLLVEVMNAAVGNCHFGNVIYLDASRFTRGSIDQISAQIAAQVADPQTRNLCLVDDVADAYELHDIFDYLYEIKANYNVVITTQYKSVSLESLGQVVEVKCLDQDSSWQLFLEAAGENEAILEDMEIREVAREMVERCGGLPIALSAVGAEARHWVSRVDWDSAGEVIDDIVCDVILGKLNDTEKECLLFWALFPNHHKLVNRDHLVDYWIGEGQSRKRGETIIAALTDNFLLEEVGEERLTVQSIVHSAICSLVAS